MRHVILWSTFAFWAVMMVLLYRDHIRPQVPQALDDRALEALFGDDFEPIALRSIWFGEAVGKDPGTRLGWLETRSLRVTPDEMQVRNRISIQPPRTMAALIPGSAEITGMGVATISRFQGLREYTAQFQGLGMEFFLQCAREWRRST